MNRLANSAKHRITRPMIAAQTTSARSYTNAGAAPTAAFAGDGILLIFVHS
jgi:hypothetical protein